MQVSPQAGWLPSKIATIDGRQYVLAVKFDPESVKAPFLEIDLDTSTESILVPMEEVPAWGQSDRTPAGFIFHMSRTGSTVAGMMLRASGDVAVVSEPLAVNGLFFRPDDGPDAPLADEVRAVIAWFVAALGTRRRVVFKFASWLSLHLDRFQAWYPSVPCVFMYREPVEVASAVINEPPFLFRRAAMRTDFDNPPPQVPDYEARTNAELRGRVDYRRDCDYVEFVARFLGAICESAAATRAGSRPVLPVGYRTFKQQVLDEMAPAFGVDLDDRKRALMLEATRYDVKRLGQVAFRDDSIIKRLRATPLMSGLCDRFIQPSIDVLTAKR